MLVLALVVVLGAVLALGILPVEDSQGKLKNLNSFDDLQPVDYIKPTFDDIGPIDAGYKKGSSFDDLQPVDYIKPSSFDGLGPIDAGYAKINNIITDPGGF